MKKIIVLIIISILILPIVAIPAQADRDEDINLNAISKIINEEIVIYTKEFIESEYPSLMDDNKDIDNLVISEGRIVYDLDLDQALTDNKTRLSTMIYDSDITYYIFYTLLDGEAGIYLQVDNQDGGFKVTSIGGLAKNFQTAEQIMQRICDNENEELNYKVYSLNFFFNDYLMVYEKNGQEYIIPFGSNALDSSYLQVSDYRQLPTANTIIKELKQKTIELQERIKEECGDQECYDGGGIVLTTQATALSMINDNKVDDYTTLFLVTAFFSIAILTVAFYMFKRGKKRAISTNNKLN